MRRLLLVTVLLLAAPVGAAYADNAVLSGQGTQVSTHATVVDPGFSQSVTIVNHNPGYTNFLVYISAVQADGSEKVVAAAIISGAACREDAGGCTVTLFNTSDLTATKLTVVGSGGQGPRATADISHNP